MTRDWTGVGSFKCKSSVKEAQSSVNKPRRFQERDGSADDDCWLLCLLAESSGEFLGMRKGARDLDMADRSEELAGVAVENSRVCCKEFAGATIEARCLDECRTKADTPCR